MGGRANWRPGLSRWACAILAVIGIGAITLAFYEPSKPAQLTLALLAQIPLIVAYLDWRRARFAPPELRKMYPELAERVPCEVKVTFEGLIVATDGGVFARDGEVLRFQGSTLAFDLGPQDVFSEHGYGDLTDRQTLRYADTNSEIRIEALPYWHLDPDDKADRTKLLRHLFGWIRSDHSSARCARRPLVLPIDRGLMRRILTRQFVCFLVGLPMALVGFALFILGWPEQSPGVLIIVAPVAVWQGMCLLGHAETWRTRAHRIGVSIGQGSTTMVPHSSGKPR